MIQNAAVAKGVRKRVGEKNNITSAASVGR